uniref:Uncharacterized protein n=1 Tax=Meloidogyne enterolobii TaxID=390850 RepID=A0A6V7V495_MELEN|nr:unnamed protein product [Meloidogyne enterolobii]
MFSLFYSIFSTTTNSFSPPLKILNSSKNPRNIEGGNALFMDVLLEESTEEIVLNDAELQFYGLIRRHLICLIVFTFFYAISFCLIRYIKTRSDNDELYAGDEDYYVYRISTWICANSLSISIGAVTLLPFSVLGAEVLQLYPDNFYLKWLNFSLINTLWAYVFLLSNLSLFVLLPFSYFFIESQGFSLTLRLQTLSGSIGHPLLARFYEALVVCSLVLVILVGIADCLHAHLFARPSRIWYTLLYFSSLSAPLLYSLASLLGVFLLLLSVPLGFARLFDIFSLMLMTRNQIRLKSEGKRKSLDEPFDLNGIYFDAINPERLQQITTARKSKFGKSSTNQYSLHNGYHQQRDSIQTTTNNQKNLKLNKSTKTRKSTISSIPSNRKLSINSHPKTKLFLIKEIFSKNAAIGGKIFTTFFVLISYYLGNIKKFYGFSQISIDYVYSFCFNGLVISILMVICNTLQLLFGFRHLPAYVQYVEEYRHTLGIFGAIIEVTIILYIMLSSLIGLYSIPFIKRIYPHRGKTSLTSIIINCMLISILSAALPILVRTLGITTFDLLSGYGRINWISNLSLVLSYNILFAGASIYCIIYKFTGPVRRELIRRVYTIVNRKRFDYPDEETSIFPIMLFLLTL